VSRDEGQHQKGLLLLTIVAVGAPVIGVACLIVGVVQAIRGEPIGYLISFLGVVMFVLGYYFIRILRLARCLPR
jgi:hypothetical protein